MSKRFRQYFGILAAVISYYIIHEGAHLVAALYYGVFKGINFMGLGMQIDVYAERLTDTQLGLFCLAGPVATLLFGWVLILLAKRICTSKSKLFKAVMWYVSLAILIIDPLYMSVLCGFFGGGDMNGITLLLPEVAARILFGVILVINGLLFWKVILPKYKMAFLEIQ